MTASELIAEPGSQEIVMTRVFDAPRDLVFHAYMDPTAIPRWWGPSRYTTTVEEHDARRGGTWRFVQRAEDGGEHAFSGVYHAVVAPERVVGTFEYEGMPGHVLLSTVTFEDRGGKTLMRSSSVFQSREDRDGMLQSGMEDGANEGFDRFDILLRERQAA
jgi:uncharacterized protein YndB with AHSA1/START domain